MVSSFLFFSFRPRVKSGRRAMGVVAPPPPFESLEHDRLLSVSSFPLSSLPFKFPEERALNGGWFLNNKGKKF